MPAFVLALLGGLVSIASSIAGRILVSLGVGFVSFTGISATLDWLKGQVISNMGALPQVAVEVMGLMKADVCVSILFSAVAARLLLNGLTSGSLKRMVFK